MCERICTAPFPARHTRQPIVSERYESVIIHVEHPELINYSRPFQEWLLRARPLPAEMDLVHAVLRGELQPWHVDVRARVSRRRKLMIRAVRAHLAGQFIYATQLVYAAREFNWHEGGIEEVDLLNGLRHDLFNEASSPRNKWLPQADWWAGGSWTGAAAAAPYWKSIAGHVARDMRKLDQLRGEIAGLIQRRIAEVDGVSACDVSN